MLYCYDKVFPKFFFKAFLLYNVFPNLPKTLSQYCIYISMCSRIPREVLCLSVPSLLLVQGLVLYDPSVLLNPFKAPFIVHFKGHNSLSPLDVMPARFLKGFFSHVGPAVLSIGNICLSIVCVPSYFKHTVVHLLFKKSSLDLLDFTNFRLIN